MNLIEPEIVTYSTEEIVVQTACTITQNSNID